MVGILPQNLGPRSTLVGPCLQKGVAVAMDETVEYVEGREDVRKREILLANAYIDRLSHAYTSHGLGKHIWHDALRFPEGDALHLTSCGARNRLLGIGRAMQNPPPGSPTTRRECQGKSDAMNLGEQQPHMIYEYFVVY